MNHSPLIHEPVYLDGAPFTRVKLLTYCQDQARHADVPAWKQEILAFIALFLDPSGEAIIQKSSGSTGDPKTFSLSRDAMVESARRTIQYFHLEKGEQALLCLPVHYIAGKMMIVRALVGGMNLLLREPRSRPLENLKGRIGFAALVPLQIEESLNHGDPLTHISKLLVGGGELHPATREKLSAMSNPEIYESFGMTETYTHFALRQINGAPPDAAFNVLEGVRIGVDSRGCLEVEVPGVTKGAICTNDLVKITQEGNGFTWLGRFDNLINSGGIKLIPELLEEQVRDCIGYECLVLPEADRKLGNRLVLLVEYDGNSPPIDDWLELLKKRLSGYELPRSIITTRRLPRNASLKPDRTSARNLLL